MVEAQLEQAAHIIPNRIVIDTNVLLDLFVFADPRWQGLMLALQEDRLQAMTRADCAREWEIVLGYSHLPLDQAGRQSAQANLLELRQQAIARNRRLDGGRVHRKSPDHAAEHRPIAPADGG